MSRPSPAGALTRLPTPLRLEPLEAPSLPSGLLTGAAPHARPGQDQPPALSPAASSPAAVSGRPDTPKPATPPHTPDPDDDDSEYVTPGADAPHHPLTALLLEEYTVVL